MSRCSTGTGSRYRGLTAADFTILEDGQPQTIRTFKAIDLGDIGAAEPVWLREHP